MSNESNDKPNGAPKPKRKRRGAKQVEATPREHVLTIYQRIRDAVIRGSGLTVTAKEACKLLREVPDVAILAHQDDARAIERAQGDQLSIPLLPESLPTLPGADGAEDATH